MTLDGREGRELSLWLGRGERVYLSFRIEKRLGENDWKWLQGAIVEREEDVIDEYFPEVQDGGCVIDLSRKEGRGAKKGR